MPAAPVRIAFSQIGMPFLHLTLIMLFGYPFVALNCCLVAWFFQISLFISFLFSINLTFFTPKSVKVDMVAFRPYIFKLG